MERQVSTITPADIGTMMLPGAAAGALGFTAANIGKQLLASKFKGYGHLATSSLASAGFGALVGGLGGSFINKKPMSTPIQASYNNEMNNNNYIDKQAGILSPVKRFVGILRGKNIETAQKGMEKAWNMHNKVYPNVLDKELAAAKASGNYTNFNKAVQRSSDWREMYNKQVQHFNDAKQLTRNTRIATGLGLGAAGGLGVGALVSNRGQEKRAGITDYAKKYWRLVSGKDLKRAVKAEQKAHHFGYDVYPEMIEKQFKHTIKTNPFSSAFDRRANVLKRMSNRMDKWDALHTKLMKRTNSIRHATSAARWGTGLVGLGALTTAAHVADRNAYNNRVKHASIDSLTAAASADAEKYDAIRQQYRDKAFPFHLGYLGALGGGIGASLAGSRVAPWLVGASIPLGLIGSHYSTKANEAEQKRDAARTALEYAKTAAVNPAFQKKALQFIGKHPWITGGLGVGTAILASNGINKGLNILTDNIPKDPAVQIDGSSAYYKNQAIADATKGVRNYMVGDVIRSVGHMLRANNHPIVGRLVGSIGSGTQFSGKIMGAKGLYDAYKGFTAPN